MDELRRRHHSAGREGGDDRPQRVCMLVRPDAEIVVGDTALRRDRQRFGEHEARPADAEPAVMLQMEIERQAVLAGHVLLHRRNRKTGSGS